MRLYVIQEFWSSLLWMNGGSSCHRQISALGLRAFHGILRSMEASLRGLQAFSTAYAQSLASV